MSQHGHRLLLGLLACSPLVKPRLGCLILCRQISDVLGVRVGVDDLVREVLRVNEGPLGDVCWGPTVRGLVLNVEVTPAGDL